MSYHGYLQFVTQYAGALFSKNNKKINILEIGVDTGISLFALNNNLNCQEIPFEYTGVDIMIQIQVPVINYTFLQKYKENKINLIEKNSLDYLESCNDIFDIVLIDGDHNYETVAKELGFLNSITHKNSLIICDDYNGRWSEKDLYYSERDLYKENIHATPHKNLDRQGVGNAINDFIKENESFKLFSLMQGEPVCMIRNNNDILSIENKND